MSAVPDSTVVSPPASPASQPPPLTIEDDQVLRFNIEAQRVLCRQIEACAGIDPDRAQKLRWRLVLAHLVPIQRTVVWCHRHWLAAVGVSLDDAHSASLAAAYNAAQRFDPGRALYVTYVQRWIQGACLRMLRSTQRPEVCFTYDELSEMSVTSGEELIADLSCRRQLQALWQRAALTEPQRDVVVYRFGLLNHRPLSMEAAGLRLGFSAATVFRHEQAALRKLRAVAGVDLSELD